MRINYRIAKYGPQRADSLLGLILWTAVLTLACSCSGPGRLRGGRAMTAPKSSGGFSQSLVQGDDASQSSKQKQDTVRVRTYTLPPGSRLEDSRLETSGSGLPLTNVQSVLVSAAMPVIEREETHATTELGAAQKNTAGELSAKLSSLKGVVWVGLGMFVFGLASLVWPPLKTVIGSVTTSAGILAGGIALMLLPTLVVGNELLLFAGVALALGLWFIAHRHGQLRGMVSQIRNSRDLTEAREGHEGDFHGDTNWTNAREKKPSRAASFIGIRPSGH